MWPHRRRIGCRFNNLTTNLHDPSNYAADILLVTAVKTTVKPCLSHMSCLTAVITAFKCSFPSAFRLLHRSLVMNICIGSSYAMSSGQALDTTEGNVQQLKQFSVGSTCSSGLQSASSPPVTCNTYILSHKHMTTIPPSQKPA